MREIDAAKSVAVEMKRLIIEAASQIVAGASALQGIRDSVARSARTLASWKPAR